MAQGVERKKLIHKLNFINSQINTKTGIFQQQTNAKMLKRLYDMREDIIKKLKGDNK